MSDRVIRDEILTSDRWLTLPRNTHRLAFCPCLVLNCDAFGNMEASDGQLWRLWHEPLALTDRSQIPEILAALISADLARIYEVDGKRYLHLPRTRNRLRYMRRICPLSPWTTIEQANALKQLGDDSPGASQTATGFAQQGLDKKGLDKIRRGGMEGNAAPAAPVDKSRKPKLPRNWHRSDAGIAAAAIQCGVIAPRGSSYQQLKDLVFQYLADIRKTSRV